MGMETKTCVEVLLIVYSYRRESGHMCSVDFAEQHSIDKDGATPGESRHHEELYYELCTQRYLDIPIWTFSLNLQLRQSFNAAIFATSGLDLTLCHELQQPTRQVVIPGLCWAKHDAQSLCGSVFKSFLNCVVLLPATHLTSRHSSVLHGQWSGFRSIVGVLGGLPIATIYSTKY